MKKEHILILEVNEKNYDVLKGLFEKNGYTTTGLCDAESFKKLKVAEDSWDLIIVNAHIPYATAIEIRHFINKYKVLRYIPLVYIDSLKEFDHNALEEAFKQGANDYLKKPFDSKEILLRVKYHISLGKKLREDQVRIDKLANLATIDQLTKLTSKMHMQAILKHELSNFKRYGKETTLLYIGIANIEKHIATFGLQDGEKLIAKVAKFLKENIRDSDVLSRWMGSEFAILLTNTGVKKAAMVARKLKSSLKEDEKLSEEPIDLACGITVFLMDDTIEELIDRVQYAYKTAKKQEYGKLEVA